MGEEIDIECSRNEKNPGGGGLNWQGPDVLVKC